MFYRLFLLFLILLNGCSQKVSETSPSEVTSLNENTELKESLLKRKTEIESINIPDKLSLNFEEHSNALKQIGIQKKDWMEQKESLQKEVIEKGQSQEKSLNSIRDQLEELKKMLVESSGLLKKNILDSIENKKKEQELVIEIYKLDEKLSKKEILNSDHQVKILTQKKKILEIIFNLRKVYYDKINSLISIFEEKKESLLQFIKQSLRDNNFNSVLYGYYRSGLINKEKELHQDLKNFRDLISKETQDEQDLLNELLNFNISSKNEITELSNKERSLDILKLQFSKLLRERERLSSDNTPTPIPIPPSTNESEIRDERRVEAISRFKTEEDPLFPYQWHLFNQGQKTFSRSKALYGMDIRAGDIYERGFSGKGIKIAISDTGLEIDHEDLRTNIIPGSRNYFTGRKENDYIDNPTSKKSFHGTSVAGIIASRGWNGKGGRGIAPFAGIAGFKFIGGSNTIHELVHQAEGDFDVFNFSYGKNPCSFYKINSHFEKSIRKNMDKLRDGLGPIYVKSAGNEFKDQAQKCNSNFNHEYYGNSALLGSNSLPYFIVVGSINSFGKKASYSSPGPNLWISAPGGEYGSIYPAILTTDLSSCDEGSSKATQYPKNLFEYGSSLNRNCSYTSTMNGTSAAAPVISGASALLLEANPKLGWRDIKHILASTAWKPDSPNTISHPNKQNLKRHIYQDGWVKNSAGFSFHNWYGFGALDLEMAIKMAEKYKSNWGKLVQTENPNSNEWDYQSGHLGRSIPDGSHLGVSHSIRVKHRLFVEAIQVKISIDHPYTSDIGIELYSPNGTKSILMNINSGIINRGINEEILLSNAFYGEDSYGDWTIKVLDGSNSYKGDFIKWEIKVFGHPFKPPNFFDIDFNPQIVINTKDWDQSRSFQAEWKNYSEGLRYEVSLGERPGTSDIMSWFNATSENVEIKIKYILKKIYSNKNYYFNLRVIDDHENKSQIFSKKWMLRK